MQNDTPNGSGGADPGDGDDFGVDPPTKVERDVARTPTQLELARADGAIFDAVASPIDALGVALGSLPAALGRLSRSRRGRLIWAVILKLGALSEIIHEVRHELTEMKRAEDEAPP